MEAVPLSAPRRGVAFRATRLPLSPHCNPYFVSKEQPRCFPPQSVRFFSLFCRTGFKGRSQTVAPARAVAALIPYPPAPRKAGYICTQRYGPKKRRCTALQVHNLFRTRIGDYHQGSTSMHKNRSQQKQGRVNHAIGYRPESASAPKMRFPPAPTQNWA